MVQLSNISQAAGVIPRRRNFGDRFGRVVHCFVNREKSFDRFRQARELHGDFRYQRERAFGADEQAGQIVAGRIERRAAEAHEFAGGKHDGRAPRT